MTKASNAVATAAPVKKAAVKKVRAKKAPKVSVSELNVRKAATRLFVAKLVSTEIAYIQRVLGNTATQDALDEKVLAVRRLPWSSIALPD
ncbi:MAG: hypothetical protein ABI779_22175 [Acidobacteriota bacterium]